MNPDFSTKPPTLQGSIFEELNAEYERGFARGFWHGVILTASGSALAIFFIGLWR